MSQNVHENPFTDPSLQDGEEIVYCKEINFKICVNGKEEVSKPLIIKMFTKVDQFGSLEKVRFEISQQADIFFLYHVAYDPEGFEKLRSEEKLKTEFNEFPEVMADILDKAAAGKNEYFVVFDKQDNGDYSLNIVMPLKFKDVPIFSLSFTQADDGLIRNQIQYRYNIVQYELRKTRLETSNFIDALKLRDPSQMKAFQHNKSPRAETKSPKKT